MPPKKVNKIEVFESRSKAYRKQVEDLYKNFASLKRGMADIYSEWERRTADLEARSYAYLFSYDQRRFIKGKGMNLIGNVSYSDGTFDRDEYISRIIKEQRGLYTWEVRKVTCEIFNKRHDLFEKHRGEYIYLCDLTIMDMQGKPWHTHHAIEPLAYDEENLLVIYFGRVYFVNPGTHVPFSSNFYHRKGQGDENILRNLRKQLSKIKKEQMDIIGINESLQTDYLNYIEEGYNSEYVANYLGIKAKTIETYRSRFIQEKFSQYFPMLMNNYRSPQGSGYMVSPLIIGNYLKSMDYLQDGEEIKTPYQE